MTRDDVLEMARKAGLGMMLQDETCHHIEMWEGELERFAALVAERTRQETCKEDAKDRRDYLRAMSPG